MAGRAAGSVLLPAAALLVLLAAGCVAAQQIIPTGSEDSITPENTDDTSSNNGGCCAQLKVLNFSSTIPVISIQLAHTGQMAGRVTPAQAQLLGRGPNMPAVMCTCGATPGWCMVGWECLLW